jgi:hypothetical protein
MNIGDERIHPLAKRSRSNCFKFAVSSSNANGSRDFFQMFWADAKDAIKHYDLEVGCPVAPRAVMTFSVSSPMSTTTSRRPYNFSSSVNMPGGT